MAKSESVEWTRDHFLVTLNLYCKLPFGKLHKSNRVIIETADKMGRHPNSNARQTRRTGGGFLEYPRETIFMR
jgi:hypothetical protein